MTFLEKAIEQSPQLSAEGITTAFCPEELRIESGYRMSVAIKKHPRA